MGSKENNPDLVRPSNFQEFVWGQRLRDVHNITRKECPRKKNVRRFEFKKNVPKVVRGLHTRFAQLLQQQPKETKEVSVSSFAANPQLCRTLIRKRRDRSRMN